MEVRLVGIDEAEELRTLRLRALQEEPEAFGSSWEEENARPLEQTIARLQANDTTAFGGYDDDGKLVGMVRLWQEGGVKTAHKAFIISMYVAPEARGRGLGRMLLEAAINRAREILVLEQLLLAVVTTNAAARALYVSVGFQPYGLEPAALKLGDRHLDEELMVLFLRK